MHTLRFIIVGFSIRGFQLPRHGASRWVMNGRVGFHIFISRPRIYWISSRVVDTRSTVVLRLCVIREANKLKAVPSHRSLRNVIRCWDYIDGLVEMRCLTLGEKGRPTILENRSRGEYLDPKEMRVGVDSASQWITS